MGTKEFNVPFPTDEHGFFGRECPSCNMYFKLKPVTDFTTTQGICPYCGYTIELQDFITQDQREYLESIAANEFLVPLLRDFASSLKRLETSSNDFVQIKVNTNIPKFPIRYYQEMVLETDVTCDTCGLIFSIYGVFSNCPACGKLNARVIYQKSLDASSKKLVLAGDATIDEEIKYELIKDALTGTVSAFDALGKALRTKHTVIPAKPPNLFQNFLALDKVLANLTGKNISQILTVTDSDFLLLMFQVRHIYEHNAGVTDSDFVSKLPAYSGQLRRKFPLEKDHVSLFIALMRKLGDEIYNEFEK
jgi:predicted RNA-binding Zn-ribbon protein involved in translation (DUF1610 family)